MLGRRRSQSLRTFVQEGEIVNIPKVVNVKFYTELKLQLILLPTGSLIDPAELWTFLRNKSDKIQSVIHRICVIFNVKSRGGISFSIFYASVHTTRNRKVVLRESRSNTSCKSGRVKFGKTNATTSFNMKKYTDLMYHSLGFLFFVQ